MIKFDSSIDVVDREVNVVEKAEYTDENGMIWEKIKVKLDTGAVDDNRMVLDKNGSYIENERTGSRIKTDHENGAFTFDFLVPGLKSEKPGKVKKSPAQKITTGKYDAFMEESD